MKKTVRIFSLLIFDESSFVKKGQDSIGVAGQYCRIILSVDGLPQRTVWLLIRRTPSDGPEYSYFISNASSNTRLKKIVWLSGLRWAIEQCFEEAKTELGMNHYEVLKFKGWHHHILTCMLAHFFLWHLKIGKTKASDELLESLLKNLSARYDRRMGFGNNQINFHNY